MTVRHDTVRIDRVMNATAERIFDCWRNSAALARWYLPGGEAWHSEILEHDFRVGGGKRLLFGPAGETPYAEDCRYEDIVENQRIVFTMTISTGGERLTASLVTVELEDLGSQARIVVTDQLAQLTAASTAEERKTGWLEVLEKLVLELTCRN